jgi:murein DD-endopeptidase MepM/ murein hydrolase activator NlpD
LPKVTVLWFPNDDKPFKTISLNKSVIFLILGGLIFFLTLSAIFIGTTWEYHEELSKYQQLSQKLKHKVESKQQTLSQKTRQKQEHIQQMEQLISKKEERIADLRQQLVKSQKQLKDIRKMEERVRHYLGLEPINKKANEKHSHQGGFEDVSSLSQQSELPEDFDPSSSTDSPVLSYSLTLEQSLDEVYHFLKSRQKEMTMVPSILPVAGEDVWLSCVFGWRENPFTDRKEFHSAIDVAGPWKTPIIAPADGRVIKAGRNRIWGKYIRLQHGKGMITAYGHLNSLAVSEGDVVKRRDVIGYMGNTGHSTGTHLHYKVIKDGKPVDPKKYVLDREFNSLSLRDEYEKVE